LKNKAPALEKDYTVPSSEAKDAIKIYLE